MITSCKVGGGTQTGTDMGKPELAAAGEVSRSITFWAMMQSG